MPTCRFIALLLGLASSLAAAVVPDATSWQDDRRERFAGMPVRIAFTPADQPLADRAWALLDEYERQANDWRDDSEIGRINAGGPGRHQLSSGLAELFGLAEQMHGATGGAFDCTVGPLRRLWRGAAASGVWPEADQLQAVRAALGPAVYRRSGTDLEVLRPGVRFDFGGVKGAVLDRVSALLRQAGRTAAMVQISGETCCWGTSLRGAPHRLAIPDPDAPDDPARMRQRIQDQGEGLCGSTSGNYRQPIVIGGRTVYHIYDPRSGLPVDTHVLSVSVVFPGIGRNGMADACTKAGAVLGPPGLALVEQAGGQALMLVRQADGSIATHATAGWNRYAVQAEAPR